MFHAANRCLCAVSRAILDTHEPKVSIRKVQLALTNRGGAWVHVGPARLEGGIGKAKIISAGDKSEARRLGDERVNQEGCCARNLQGRVERLGHPEKGEELSGGLAKAGGSDREGAREDEVGGQG